MSSTRRLDDLKRVARDRFWHLDPASVSDEPEFTFDEYFDIADRAAFMVDTGVKPEAVEASIARELRDDWGVPRWAETAREVTNALQVYLNDDD